MSVAKPNITWVAAHPTNYTVGRLRPIRYITFHHVVGSDDSAVNKFKTAGVSVSAHFVCGDTKITQMVDLNNTAWCNGNWDSNNECITIEHEGDWRNGYRNQAVIDNSAKLVAWLRTVYPNIGFNRHRDVKATACPADLPVEEIWNKASKLIADASIPPAAPSPSLALQDIQNKIVITNKDANLWDLNFTSWATAKSIKVIPKGTEVEVSATAKHPLGGTYYLTEYSYSKGIMNGINLVDCSDKVIIPPTPEPPVEPPVEPPKPPTPTEYDQQQDAQISAIQKQLDALKALVQQIIDWITSWGKK